MKRNTSNWSNFGMLLRRAGLTASAGLSCIKSSAQFSFFAMHADEFAVNILIKSCV